MSKRSWCAAMLCSTALLLPGCSQKPEDEVLAQYQRGEEAIAAGNSLEFRDTLTPESMAMLTEAKRLALECPEKECKTLSPPLLLHVIRLRNRLKASELRAMDADKLLQWYLDEEMYSVDSEMDIYPHDVTIQGDEARIQMGEKVDESTRSVRFGRRRGGASAVSEIANLANKPKTKPIPGYVLYYKKLNGYWYHDAIATEQSRRSLIEKFARASDMSVQDYIVWLEEDAFGSIKPDIWKPLK